MKINPAEYKILVVDDVQSNVLLLAGRISIDGAEEEFGFPVSDRIGMPKFTGIWDV